MPDKNECPNCGEYKNRQSNQCRECYLEKLRSPESYVDQMCPVCGDEFTVHEGQLDAGYGKYCSRSCARSGSPTRTEDKPVVQCENCGEEFKKHKSEIRKNEHDLHFCCQDCWYEYNQGENHYSWKGGQQERLTPEYREWRQAVLKRDGKRCRTCQSTENLEVHHIKPFGDFPDLQTDVDNGVVLCQQCHQNVTGEELEYAKLFDLVATTEHQYCESHSDFLTALASHDA